MSNLVIVMSDEHNPFYSSPYGHEFIKTPNMQKLANEGTVFKNSYCSSPLCLPSRSAFVSGKRVHQIQTYSNCNVNLEKNIPSYGKVLKDNGVHSVHIGKVDVYADGEKLGFSEMLNPQNRKLPGDVNHQRTPLNIRKGADARANGFGIRTERGDDEHCIDLAIEWIEKKGASINKDWVLCVNVVNPHFPHLCPEEFWKMYEGCEDLPAYGLECDSAWHPYACDLRSHFQTEGFTKEQVRGLRRGYYGCISFVDQQFGRVVDALESSGLRNDTNIVYTSDHGEMLGKLGMWWKCSLYEDSVRIPMIASGPNFKKGKIVDTPVDLLDLSAFTFKSSGLDIPKGFSGTPLDELPENDKERFVFSEYHGHGTRSGAYMIRKGDWKFIMSMEAENQLFNLANDPHELNNLIEKYPAKANEFEECLRSICNPEEENKRAHEFENKQFEKIYKNYSKKQ
jgi:choline-sulfatase